MLVNKPTNIYKGQATTFTLNHTELAAHSAITIPYWTDASNWKKVLLKYVSSNGNQSEVVSFYTDGRNATPYPGTFETSLKARPVFQVESIILTDYDNSHYFISRSELSSQERSELDVSLL